MEPLQMTMGILDLMVQPAFCVSNGVIAGANADARRFQIHPGEPVEPLLADGLEEYREFRSGCLYLTLNIHTQRFGASVTKNGDFDIFVLEDGADQAELNAMALAAQELREPLTSVMTLADQLFPVIGDDTASREKAARVNRGLFQMIRIIGNMSDAARYHQCNAGGQEMRNITAIFEELFHKAEVLVEKTGIHLRFHNLSERIYMLVNEEQLERAVYNMLSNALKFTPKDGTVDIHIRHKDRKIYLTIQDDGPGVPPGIRSSVHARYQRQPGLESGHFGIGLGMVLIRSAAAAHGGTVLMEHPEEGGARITMTLQIRQTNGANFRSQILKVDYTGELDHALVELSDVLPATLYDDLPSN